jgi:glycosyltransferase involved in cell wall biosynthesis
VTRPRVVIAAPLYRAGDHLDDALGSLLAQTFRDFALVLVDDASGDGTAERARALAAGDDRVEVHVNPERLGVLANTNRAYALATQRAPSADYFALASDHDVWDPRWLERLVAALDDRPAAVLAYPLRTRIDVHGREIAGPWRFETAGVHDPRVRLHRTLRRMMAGDMVYGLFRAGVLAELGQPYAAVLYPDRLLIAELALRGEFVQVPDVLWRRRVHGPPSPRRQRRALWLGRAPLHSYVPSSAVHAAIAARRHGLRLALLDWFPASTAVDARGFGQRLAYAPVRVVAPPVARSRLGRAVAAGRIPAPRRVSAAMKRLSE